MTQKNWIIIVIIIFLLVIVIGGAIFSFDERIDGLQNKINNLQQNQSQNTNSLGTNINQDKVGGLDAADSESKDEWQIYIHPYYSWKISYPKNWKNRESNDSVIFYPPDLNPDLVLENNSGFIGWKIYQNPKKLSLEQFFDGNSRPNYFSDAQSIKNIVIDGASGKEFKGVGGMLTYTIAVIPMDTVIIELIDNGEKYQSNGIFDKMLNSIKF